MEQGIINPVSGRVGPNPISKNLFSCFNSFCVGSLSIALRSNSMPPQFALRVTDTDFRECFACNGFRLPWVSKHCATRPLAPGPHAVQILPRRKNDVSV